VELCILSFAFRHETALKYHNKTQIEVTHTKFDARAMFKYLATWLSASYFLAYIGTEVAISGWVVSFMMRYCHAPPYLSNITSSAFWGGMTVGRFTLSFVTDKLGVGRANIFFFIFAVTF